MYYCVSYCYCSDCIIVITSLHKPAYSFMWEEPELKYTGAPIAENQAHLALEPLLPDAMGSELSSYDVRLLTTLQQPPAFSISCMLDYFLKLFIKFYYNYFQGALQIGSITRMFEGIDLSNQILTAYLQVISLTINLK